MKKMMLMLAVAASMILTVNAQADNGDGAAELAERFKVARQAGVASNTVRNAQAEELARFCADYPTSASCVTTGHGPVAKETGDARACGAIFASAKQAAALCYPGVLRVIAGVGYLCDCSFGGNSN